MLSTVRYTRGKSAYAHEEEAIDFLVQHLPDREPYYLWALVELHDPSAQRLYEIDAIVIGYGAVYLVEIKSGPGTYKGGVQDWLRTPEGQRPIPMDAPYPLANKKAKVLASRLRAKMGSDAPWVQALVFLSADDVRLQLDPPAMLGVVRRDNVTRALVQGEFPGRNPQQRTRPINTRQRADIMKALRDVLVKRQGEQWVNDYRLTELLDSGPGFSDYLAEHRSHAHMRRRARVYLVPQQTSPERRAQLRRAADREAQLLADAAGHDNVLKVHDIVPDAGPGPTVLFEGFEGAQRLDAFVRTHALTFEERVHILAKLGHALGYCHRKDILHGNVSPEAVLMRQGRDGGELEVKLFNFQLGKSADSDGTYHVSALTSDAASSFLAPELVRNPTGPTRASDMFSLGALAYYLLTDRLPAAHGEELLERVERDGALDPRAAGDGIDDEVAELVKFATELSLAERCDDPSEWADMLLDHATRPESELEPTVDPLVARPGDALGLGLYAERLLGTGATSRVLRVRLGERDDLALKVSLDPSHDVRLAAEAEVLRGLRHARIVELLDIDGEHLLTVGGRRCLLLSLAGEKTLYKLLQADGPPPLDYAIRYGEDLLSALEHLEEVQVVHRDIKPANLGVGAIKKRKEAHHLTLFDFSLANAPAAELFVGTAAYRDPYLRERKLWDAAADRWSAAITLHELLTGARPGWDAESNQVVLAAERFDPQVRAELSAFFARAFSSQASERHPSAEDMRLDWVRCFVAPGRVAAASEPSDHAPTPHDEGELALIEPDALLAALPMHLLSVRARNALDRAGLMYVKDLLTLPNNRLSAMRGVGRLAARDVLDFRDAWKRARKVDEPTREPFWSGYAGADKPLAAAGFAPLYQRVLVDAGLASLAVLAAAERTQVVRLADKHGLDLDELRRLLEAAHQAGLSREHPQSLEAWVEALLSSEVPYARQLYGLDEPHAGRIELTAGELARALGKTAPAVYQAIARYRGTWRAHPAIGDLQALAHSVVAEWAHAMPLGRAAAALAARLGVVDASEQPTVQAAALLRVVTEVEHEVPGGLRFVRLSGASPWLVTHIEAVEELHQLGRAADDLASRPTLPAASEVLRALRPLVESTSFSQLTEERLLDLAASASSTAARSTRLELYPRGLAPARAIELVASVLVGDLSPEEVAERVRARYPEAAPLPPPPLLDELLGRLGLERDGGSGKYRRPERVVVRSLDTQFSPLTLQSSASTSLPRSASPGALEARDFDQLIRYALQRRQLRVLQVRVDRAYEATLALERRLGLAAVALDKRLIAAMQEVAQEQEIEAEVYRQADAEGSTGEHWSYLCTLAAQAAERLLQELVPTPEPLLFTRPGLLQRYGLSDFLQRVVEASKSEASGAILLLNPAFDDGGAPRINRTLPIPGVQASQVVWVPDSWIKNEDNQAA